MCAAGICPRALHRNAPHIDNKKSKQDVDESSDLYTPSSAAQECANNNGKPHLGISYPGFFTSASIIDSHPALKARPPSPMTDLFMGDDAYHGALSCWTPTRLLCIFHSANRIPSFLPGIPSFDWERKTPTTFTKSRPLSNLSKYLEAERSLDDQVKHNTYDDYWKAATWRRI